MKKITSLGMPFWVFCFLSFQFLNAQSVGDFRSISAGNWTSPATWQKCTSVTPVAWVNATTEYPGSVSGNYAVTIATGTTVTVDVEHSVTIGNLYVEGTLELKANFTLNGGAKTIGVTNGLILFAKKVEFRLPEGTVFSMDIMDSIMQGLHGFTPPGKEECDANTAVMIWNPNLKPKGGYDRYTTCRGQPGTTGLNFADFNNTNAGLTVIASNGFTNAFCSFPISSNINFSGNLRDSKGYLVSPVTYLWQYYPPGSNVLSPLPEGITSNANSLQISSSAPLTVEGVYTFRLIFTYNKITRYADFHLYNGASSVWDGTNWSYGAPSELYPLKAVIESNYNTGTAGSFSACSCTVNPNKLLTISPNTYVKVRDNIINNGSVVVESDGNLIQEKDAGTYSGTGVFTAQRNVTALHNVSTKMDYVFWSSPVASQNLQTFSPGTPANYIQQYNEATDYFTPASGSFSKGKGYAIRAEVSAAIPANTAGYNKTYQFTGVPNNGIIPVAVTKNGNGYNLLGNPYPSNINYDALLAANPTLLKKSVWFWTNKVYQPNQQGSSYNQANYVVYNPETGANSPGVTGVIKVGQGFIVEALKGGNLNFQNSYGVGKDLRVTTSGVFYQKNTDKNRFWLQLIAPSKMVNSQMVGYFEGATDGYDADFDAEAMVFTSDLFYSVLNDKRLLIQAKSSQFKVEDQIRLGANFFENGTYTIKLEQPEGIFINGQSVYLKDRQNGTITNLSESSYTFEANKGENTDRFEIIYRPETVLVTDSKVKDAVVVYRDRDHFVI
ncbi:MAG: G8 domain-containing protein, partial [Chitinophagales bacterium]|nr:G8 domain-containing protein [Chitinophagales bacterium]